MSRKNVLEYQVLTAKSLSSSFISPVTFIRYSDNVSYQIDITTSDSTGIFSIEVSNDYNIQDGVVTNPGHWNTLTLSGTPIANAANDIISISLNQLPYIAIRLVYTANAAGTGTCDAFLVSKAIGG